MTKDKGGIHFILQGKGGVGKSLVAVLLAQYLQSKGKKVARLREIFDEVEAAKAAGVSNKVIVAALAARGLHFDINGFKNACSRIINERTLAAVCSAVSQPNTPARKRGKRDIEKARQGVPARAGNSSQSQNGDELACNESNPLHDLGKPKKLGGWNPIPTVTFEPGDE